MMQEEFSGKAADTAPGTNKKVNSASQQTSPAQEGPDRKEAFTPNTCKCPHCGRGQALPDDIAESSAICSACGEDLHVSVARGNRDTGATHGNAASSGEIEDKKPFLSVEQEAWLLPVLSAAYWDLKKSRGEQNSSDWQGALLMLLGIGAGILLGWLLQLHWLITAGVCLVAVIAFLVPLAAILTIRQNRRVRLSVSRLSNELGMESEQVARLFDLCFRVEAHVLSCQVQLVSFVEAHQNDSDPVKREITREMLPYVKSTPLSAPPKGLADRWELLKWGEMLAMVSSEFNKEYLKSLTEEGGKLVDETVEFVRSLDVTG